MDLYIEPLKEITESMKHKCVVIDQEKFEDYIIRSSLFFDKEKSSKIIKTKSIFCKLNYIFIYKKTYISNLIFFKDFIENPDSIDGNYFSQELFFQELDELDKLYEPLERDLNEHMLFETRNEYNITHEEYKKKKTRHVKKKLILLKNEIKSMKYFYCV